MYKFFVGMLVLAYSFGVHQGWAEEGKNLIKNGSFEEGKRPWGTVSIHNPHLVSVDPSTSTDGDFSIKLDGRTAENRFTDICQWLKLKPSTKYLLKADIKRTTSAGFITAAVVEQRGPAEKVRYHLIGINAKLGTNQWEHFEKEFTTQDKVSKVAVYLYNKTNDIAWFDNIQLYDVAQGIPTGEELEVTGVDIIKNGDFKNQLASWGIPKNHHPELVSIDKSFFEDHPNCLKLDGCGGSYFIDAQQWLKLKPSTRYLIKGNIRRTSNQSGTIQITVREKAGKTWEKHTCGHNSAASINIWEPFELEFTTAEEVDEAVIHLYNAKSKATVWFDNIQLLELSESNII